jgi:hypothetical protein
MVTKVLKEQKPLTYAKIRLDKNIKFLLPPEDSGSAKTFDILKKYDRFLRERKEQEVHMPAENYSFDSLIDRGINIEKTVIFFVQFDDPDNRNIKNLVDRMNKDPEVFVVPVWSAEIRDIQLPGASSNTPIYRPEVFHSGVRLTEQEYTACTPIAIITGDHNLVSELKSLDWRNEGQK